MVLDYIVCLCNIYIFFIIGGGILLGYNNLFLFYNFIFFMRDVICNEYFKM